MRLGNEGDRGDRFGWLAVGFRSGTGYLLVAYGGSQEPTESLWKHDGLDRRGLAGMKDEFRRRKR